MKPLTLLMLNVALLIPLFAVADENTSASTKLITTLEELGYPNGLTFDAVSQPDEHTLLFHLPKEMNVREATLRIVYRGSSKLGREASLSVGINELPPQTRVVLADQVMREWLLPVPATEMHGGQVKVTLSANTPIKYGSCANCSDGQPESGAVHVLPDSKLTILLDGLPVTLRDAWLTLPEEVVVTIPRDVLDETTFRAALDWITLLLRQHHTVRVTTLPDLGNLVIAPESDIIAAMVLVSSEPTETRFLWDKKGTNVGVVNFGDGTFIAATTPYANVQRFESGWQQLSRQEHIATVHPGGTEKERERIGLDALGVSTATAKIGHKLEWTAYITPWNLPLGMRPESAIVQMQLPHAEPQKYFRLFIYLNDVLIRSERFSSDGLKRDIEASFGSVPRSDTYQLRVVVRDDGENDNIKPTTLYPVRITPQSYLSLKKETRSPVGFSSVPTVLGFGFDLYITRDYLAKASHYLPLLGQLLNGFMVAATDYTIVVLDPGHAPVPQRNFIAASVTPPEDAPIPLRFDEGRVQLVDYRNETLIDEQHLRRGSVIQLVRWNDTYGLWLHPGELNEVPVIDVNRLGTDDVAVYESDQLALSIDSHQEDLVRPQYLEHPRWFERLYRQRILWLLFSWALLTLIIVYLYIKTKQHRNI